MPAGYKDFISPDKMIMTTDNLTSVCVNITTNYNCDSDRLKRFNATLTSRAPAVCITDEKATALITIKNSEGELI